MSVTLSQFEILKIYHTNVLKFLDSLTELLKNDETDLSDIIVMRILFENQIPIEESLQKFSSKLLTPIDSKDGQIIPADMIRNRNDQFFIEHSSSIFAGINGDKMVHWKDLWTSKRLDKEDKESIWKWMLLFLKLAEMYEANNWRNAARPTLA